MSEGHCRPQVISKGLFLRVCVLLGREPYKGGSLIGVGWGTLAAVWFKPTANPIFWPSIEGWYQEGPLAWCSVYSMVGSWLPSTLGLIK